MPGHDPHGGTGPAILSGVRSHSRWTAVVLVAFALIATGLPLCACEPPARSARSSCCGPALSTTRASCCRTATQTIRSATSGVRRADGMAVPAIVRTGAPSLARPRVSAASLTTAAPDLDPPATILRI